MEKRRASTKTGDGLDQRTGWHRSAWQLCPRLVAPSCYAWEFWGEVPQAVRPYYVSWMFVAAVGYLLFTQYLFFYVDPDTTRVARRFDFTVFNFLYLLILVPSAAWMPLTFEMIEQPNNGLWLTIRATLWIVGLASVALVAALLSLHSRKPGWAYWTAVGGSIAFTAQTALIDAVVWTAFFPA